MSALWKAPCDSCQYCSATRVSVRDTAFCPLFLPPLILALFPHLISSPACLIDGTTRGECIAARMDMHVLNPSFIRSYRGLGLEYLRGEAGEVDPYRCSIDCCKSKEPIEIARGSPPPTGTTAAISNVHDLQITGSTVIAAGRDYNVVNNHYHSQPPRDMLREVLRLVPNFRKIYQDMLSKVTDGTGLWMLDGDTFRLFIAPNGDIQILWGSGIRKSPLHNHFALY
jgi:hypothetical protein